MSLDKLIDFFLVYPACILDQFQKGAFDLVDIVERIEAGTHLGEAAVIERAKGRCVRVAIGIIT